MKLSDIIENLNGKKYTFDGHPVKVWVVDDMVTGGMDTISVHMMFDDPETKMIIKDCYCISRYLFENNIQAAVFEFEKLMWRFCEKINNYRDNADLDMEEIEI